MSSCQSHVTATFWDMSCDVAYKDVARCMQLLNSLFSWSVSVDEQSEDTSLARLACGPRRLSSEAIVLLVYAFYM